MRKWTQSMLRILSVQARCDKMCFGKSGDVTKELKFRSKGFLSAEKSDGISNWKKEKHHDQSYNYR